MALELDLGGMMDVAATVAGTSFELVPPGKYNFVIEEATYEESQAGNPTLKCKIRITGPQGPAVGKTMFHRFTLVMPGGSSERPEDVSKRERNWKIFFDDMVTLGFDPAWVRSCRTLEPVAQYMIDRRFSSTVTHKPSGGNTYANTGWIKPVFDESAAGPSPFGAIPVGAPGPVIGGPVSPLPQAAPPAPVAAAPAAPAAPAPQPPAPQPQGAPGPAVAGAALPPPPPPPFQR